MRLLLDTHVALGLLVGPGSPLTAPFANLLADPATEILVSVASLWEMAIKTRLAKLDPGMPLTDIAGYLQAIGVTILTIEATHVTLSADPEPPTRDPFDRLLLAQCQAENLKLATLDRALAGHPLAV